MVNKALPIAEALYLSYLLFYLFDNATRDSVYTKDALQTKDMNKKCGGKQSILQNRWFHQEDICITQLMNFLNEKNQKTQKELQKVLEERRLWPAKKLNLSCLKPKRFNC